jgi:alkane 1-monooxygenase
MSDLAGARTGFVDDTSRRHRRHWAWCLLPQLVFVAFAIGVLGRGLWCGLPVILLLVVLPGLDLVTGWQDDHQPRSNDFGPLELALLRWNPRLYAALNVAALLFIILSVKRFSALELWLLGASASLVSAVGFAAAHELLHGQRADQWVQRVLTPFLFYPHYKLIHIYAHHVHVGTPADENTAWRGESIYQYLWRTVPGSVARCWTLDRERRSRADRRFNAKAQPLRNRMLLHAAGQLALLAALFGLSGSTGLLFYIGHVIGAHVVVESVNYIQHYGLLRREIGRSGTYERTAPEHSWDTYHFFSSYVTFRVGHHASHHLSAGPYYLLSPEPASPRLPVGYFWAIPLVLLPPAWWLVIDPRLSGRQSDASTPQPLA